MEMPRKRKTPAQALIAMQRFCAYQERCHQETRYKLLEIGIYGDELEQILASLVEEGYLNEERFARSFVRGRYRMKRWGRQRILLELKQRKISDYCIRMGMSEIDEEEYQANLRHVLTRKLEELGDVEPAEKRKKLFDQAYRKGYSPEEIQAAIATLGRLDPGQR